MTTLAFNQSLPERPAVGELDPVRSRRWLVEGAVEPGAAGQSTFEAPESQTLAFSLGQGRMIKAAYVPAQRDVLEVQADGG